MEEPYFYNTQTKKIKHLGWADEKVKAERSLIHPEYARRFIREYIL